MSTKKTSILPDEWHAGKPPLALIAGPTASGKSDYAVRLGLALRNVGREAVVINADSAQIYRDLAVLSARPTESQMQGVTHRLFGTWDGAHACSAADWATAARMVIDEAHRCGQIPILVGGTGLYLRTLLEGIAPVPAIDPAIRQAVRALPLADAYAALSREDPDRAAQLAPADTSRILRALEVIRSTGKPLAEWHRVKSGGIAIDVDLRAVILLPERASLYERCDRRFANMLERGAINEVEALLARGLDPELPVMRAIGVREITGHLEGKWSLQDARERGAQATRNYAKRQFTWFRNQPPTGWPRVEIDNYDNSSRVEILLHILRLT